MIRPALQTSDRRYKWSPLPTISPVKPASAAGPCRATKLSAADLLGSSHCQRASISRTGPPEAAQKDPLPSIPTLGSSREFKVEYKEAKVQAGYYPFYNSGYSWKLYVTPLTDDKQAAWKALVEAVAPSQERSAFTVRWSLQDSTGKTLRTHDKPFTKTFTESSPRCSWSFSDLEQDTAMFLCVLIEGPAPERSWDGDAELVVDSGKRFLVHSLLLKWSSDVFKEALASTPSASPLLLPGLTGQQTALYLQMLYQTYNTTAWLKDRSFTELLQMATACYALACTHLLRLVDDALVEQASRSIAANNAPVIYVQAQQLDLKGLQHKSSQILFTLLPQLNVSPDSKLGAEHQLLHPILREAQRLQKETTISLAEIEDNLDTLSDMYDDDDEVPTELFRAAELVKEEQGRYKSAAA